MTLGNPLYALEMGRVLAVDGPPAAGEDLRVPESLEALVGSRLQASPAGAEALLAVALGGPLRVDQLLAVTSASEIDAAVLGGLLVDDGTRYVSSHPLLATMVARQASRLRRLAVHRGLARAATDPVRVAGHLAEAASGPDSAVAATVATGAQLAFDRGASAEAVKLAREALRLTPPADPERSDRVLRLGNYLQRATEMTALAALLDRELDQLPPGSPRALGHLLAAHIARSQEEYLHHLEAAGAAASDPFTRTIVLAEMVLERAMAWLDVGPGVQARADEILVLAAAAGRGLTEARYSAAWVRLLSGRPVEDLAPPAGERPGPADPSEYGYERVRGLRLAFRGCVDEARIVLAGEVASAIERGDEDAWGTAHHLLCELELRAGRTGVAEAMVDEDTSELDPLRVGMHSHAARLRAVAAAIRGDPAAARTWAGRARGLVVGQHWDVVEIERALGIAALFEGRAPTSLEHLLLVWNDTIGGSVREVGAFPVAADLVEASLASGNRELASSVVQRLSTLAAEQDHPWGLATLRRGTAMVALHDGTPVETARADLLAAADRYTALGCHFDAARTLLTLGRHARRAKRWATARDALKDALSIFDDLGCTGWAALTRELMAGVGGRRPSATSELTPSERRTVALAAVGRSNKDIAAELFVSVHTVEVHLGHAFRKLDVTSRAQLAGALERGTERESPPII
jgi:DNA-binding CsgD family transcriptional regulator